MSTSLYYAFFFFFLSHGYVWDEDKIKLKK